MIARSNPDSSHVHNRIGVQRRRRGTNYIDVDDTAHYIDENTRDKMLAYV